MLIIGLNMAICALLIVETHPWGAAHADLLWAIEIFLVSLLVVEFAARIYASPNRAK